MTLVARCSGVLSTCRVNLFSQKALISTTQVNRVDQDWRARNGLPRNPNAYGPLTDAPDFSFVNGRTPAITTGRKMRLEKQKIMAEKIMKAIGEVNFAKDRYARQLEQDAEQRKTILSQKLKPKAAHALPKPSS